MNDKNLKKRKNRAGDREAYYSLGTYLINNIK